MKIAHAFGFLLLGCMLTTVQAVAPGWFPPDGIDGTSARELWLLVMSWTLWGIGGCHLAGCALRVAGKWLEYDPQRVAVKAAAPLAPAAVGRAELPPEWLLERRAA